MRTIDIALRCLVDAFMNSQIAMQHMPNNEQIIKTIIGFCNQKGGKLIVGIENDREILGMPEEEVQKAFDFFITIMTLYSQES